MWNQIFENNGLNRTGTPCEGPSPGRCSLAQQRGPGRHPATVRVMWKKKVNKVVMEYFYRSKPFDEEGKPIRDTERECLENGEKEECLNQQGNVYVARQGQLERMAGYQNLNWK